MKFSVSYGLSVSSVSVSGYLSVSVSQLGVKYYILYFSVYM